MNPKISVIVPVYNAEKYLEQCIDSILDQTYKNLEIVLINDGSTDKSGKICDGYAKSDNRVRVLHLENGGVSNARNKGIEISTGDYITFVDADDWIDMDMYSGMLEIINEEKTDVVMCSFFKTNGNELNQPIIFPWESPKVFLDDEIKNLLIPSFVAPIYKEGRKAQLNMGSIWRCLFNSETIKRKGIKFDTRIRCQEDLVFLLQVLNKSSRVISLNIPYYYYRIDAESITQNYIKDLYTSLQLAIENISEIFHNGNYDFDISKQLRWRIVSKVLNSIYNTCAPKSPHNLMERIKLSKHYVKNSSFRNNISIADYKYFTLKQRVLITLVRINLISPIIMYYTLKNR